LIDSILYWYVYNSKKNKWTTTTTTTTTIIIIIQIEKERKEWKMSNGGRRPKHDYIDEEEGEVSREKDEFAV